MSKHTQFRLAEIDIQRHTEEDRIVGFFRYDSEQTEKKSPLLIILADISSSLYVYEQLLDVLNETADRARHLTADVQGDPMARFEKIVERLNKAVAQFIEEEPSEISWKRVNIFVMEFSEAHVCLAGIGRLANVLMQKQDSGDVKSYDLFGSLEQPAMMNPEKVFASVLCGPLNVGDSLFVGTNNFDRWRNDIRLIERIVTLPPVSAALEIKQDIESLDLPEDFVGLLISHVRITPRPGLKKTLKEPEALAAKTVQAMYQREQETQEVLTPSIAPKKPAPEPKKSSRAFSTNSFSFVKLSAELRAKAKNLFSKKKDPVTMNSLRGLSAGHGSFLSNQKKRILLAGVVGFIILGSFGGWAYFNQKAKAKAELWQALYDQVVDKKNLAEADLVYGNEARTRSQIEEAKALLSDLPEDKDEYVAKKSELLAELDGVLYKLKRETVLTDPELLVSLAADASSGSLRGLALFNGKSFAFDDSSKQVVIVNNESKEVTRADLPDNIGQVIAAAAGNSGVFAITSEKRLLLVREDGSVTNGQIQTSELQDLKDIDVYANRFYILDPASNMIWKYNPAGTGAAAEDKYLQQNSENFGNARSMAIDANIYVAFDDGRVKRYLSGAEETWAPVAVDPELDNAVSVWTTAETDRVVVADRKNKRIVIFRKDGRLVGQITSPKWEGPTFVTGDDQAKKLYVLDGNRIYQIDLP